MANAHDNIDKLISASDGKIKSYREGGKVVSSSIEAIDIPRKVKRRKIRESRKEKRAMIKSARKYAKSDMKPSKDYIRSIKKSARKAKREDIKNIRETGLTTHEKKITEKRIGYEIISKKKFKKMSKKK